MAGERKESQKTYALKSGVKWPDHFDLISSEEAQFKLSTSCASNCGALHLLVEDYQEIFKDSCFDLHLYYKDDQVLDQGILSAAKSLHRYEGAMPSFSESPSLEDQNAALRQKLKELTEKSAHNEVRLNELMERNYNPVMLRQEDGTILYINQAIEKTAGYKPSELVGKNSFDFMHPEDLEVVRKQLATMEQKDIKNAEVKVRIRHKDGHYLWIKSQISDHRYTPGIEAIISNFINVDEQEKIIEELEVSNRRFKLSSKATQDIIWDWDIQSNAIAWGENLKHILGYEDEEVDDGQKFTDKIVLEDQASFKSSVEALNESGKDLWESSYRFYHKNGAILRILDRGYALRDESGEVIRLIGAMHDISLRHEYEERLRNEELKFRQIFEGSLIGMIMLDLKSLALKDCNQALLNIIGYRKEEFLNSSLKELVPENQYGQNLERLKSLRQKAKIEAFQTTLVRKDLSETTVIVSASASNFKNEQFAWIHVLDLGPIERSTLALAEAENRFKHYIEKSSDVFVSLNEEAKYDYASPNIEQLLGYRPSEIIGMDNLSLMHPDDAETAAKAFQEAFENPGKVTRSVFRARHKNGNWVWVEANGRFEISKDRVKAYVNVRDIQKEHEIEEELRKLSLVANRTSNAVIITDADQRIDWVNESFSDMSGYSLEEAKGRFLPELLHGPLSKPIFNNTIEALLKSEKPFKAQNVNYRKSGEHYWIESIVTPVFDANQKLINYISIETDISQRKQEENTVQNYLKLITKQNDRLRNLAHIITHNFRSHAGNIIQLLEELERETKPSEIEQLQQYLKVSAESLMRSLTETSSILNQEKENELPTEVCNLMECCLRVEHLLSNEIRKIKAQINFHCSEDQEISFYPAYLDSVVFNLISNAVRYHDPEKETRIDVRCIEKEHFYVLEVQDNGLGVDLDKFGDRIFKLKQSFHGHPDSNGIGLYMIRAQLESLGGEIHVESEPGIGSTFSAYFPKDDKV